MNEAKKPVQIEHAPPAAKRESIAVKLLRFTAPTDLPGASVPTSLSTTVLTPATKNRARHEIEFIPAMRHHRVTYHGLNQPPVVCFIPETRVSSWEPE